TLVPPLARPLRFGWCCMQCYTLRGFSMGYSAPLTLRSSLGRRSGLLGTLLLLLLGTAALGTAAALAAAAATATASAAVAATLTAAAGGALLRGLLLPLGAGLRGLALVDPHLDADAAERRPGLVEAVVDVGPQRVQRDLALAVELRPRHLGAAETAAALDLDALGARLHRRLDRLAHRAAERDPAGQLLGHALRDELRVDLGVLHLEDVQPDLLAGQLLQVAPDALGLRAATADDDARPGGVNVDLDTVTGPLDLHLGDARPVHAPLQHAPDLDVFLDVVLVELVGEPHALVV